MSIRWALEYSGTSKTTLSIIYDIANMVIFIPFSILHIDFGDNSKRGVVISTFGIELPNRD
jgi:glycopeptide antibiotics resistance protein